jgi:hypothetical protein
MNCFLSRKLYFISFRDFVCWLGEQEKLKFTFFSCVFFNEHIFSIGPLYFVYMVRISLHSELLDQWIHEKEFTVLRIVGEY